MLRLQHYYNTLRQFILLFGFVIRGVAKLTLFDVLAIIMTLLGTFLLLTNGSFSNLVVNPASLFWGILAGVALAFTQFILQTYLTASVRF